MCYSSMTEEGLKKVRRHGRTEKIRMEAIEELFRRGRTRINDKPRDIPKWPRALEANFDNPATAAASPAPLKAMWSSTPLTSLSLPIPATICRIGSGPLPPSA